MSRVENGSGGTIATLLAIVRALGRQDWLAGLASRVPPGRHPTSHERKTPQRVRRSKIDSENS